MLRTVRLFNLEASHKVDPHQWLTINCDKYQFSCNGQEKWNVWQMTEKGTYNVLIGQTTYYDSNTITFEESHRAFKKSLSDGFAWEVLEVYSSAPTITFTWRHFGPMKNEFCCRGLSDLDYKVDPTNKMIEIYGMCKATINELFQIEDLQVFYDPNQLFVQLTEISPFAPFEKLSDSRLAAKKTIQQKSIQHQDQSNIEKKDLKKRNLAEHSIIHQQNSANISSKLCLIS